ncbi:hypothetical protein M3Y94_00496900 [Aphelenchoides besseyi]|nr:hypothetical protein M3Y94_00496900 [Aphelenchoides besseyi]
MQYAPININDLSLDAMIEVPTAINFPMMLDDKIFGFSEDESVNTQQLIVFSLTSRTKAVYNVETDGLTVNSFSPNSPYTWKEKKNFILLDIIGTRTHPL